MIGVSVQTNTALAAAAALFDRADTDVRKAINAANRAAVSWVQPEVTRHARTGLDRAMTSSVRVQASQRLRVVMGSAGVIRPGVKKVDLVRQVEFGGHRDKRRRYTTRSPKGTAYPVVRHTQRQLPTRDPDGRLMYAALPDIAPRLLATYIRNVADLFDSGRTRY